MRSDLMLDMTRRVTAAKSPHGTGSMVALVPDPADAVRLAESDGLDEADLHVTVAFLGDAGDWSTEHRLGAYRLAERIAESSRNPVIGRAWAAASFNPAGEHPCAALLIGDVDGLSATHASVWQGLHDTPNLPFPSERHRPWVPHLTIGYGMDVTRIEKHATGTLIHFDRLRVSFADETVDYRLP